MHYNLCSSLNKCSNYKNNPQYPAITVCVYRTNPLNMRHDLIDSIPAFPPEPREDIITQSIYYFKQSNGYAVQHN